MLTLATSLALPAWVRAEVDTDRVYADADARMELAVRLSRRNVQEQTGGPFGAAVFTQEGKLVSVGVNRVVSQTCSVAHAEMMAFILAQANTGRFRLNDGGVKHVMATSSQPCCQCYGASFWAGIDALEIGARAEDVMSLTTFDEGPLPADWIGELERRGIAVARDLRRVEAREALQHYGSLGGVNY